MARKLIDMGGGSIFLPDFNRSQIGAAVTTMEILGISVLLQDDGRDLRNTDEDLRAMAALALSRPRFHQNYFRHWTVTAGYSHHYC